MWIALVVGAGLLFAALFWVSPIAALIAGVLLVLAVTVKKLPEKALYVALALAILTLPASFPTLVSYAGVTVQLYEPFLFVAAVGLPLRATRSAGKVCAGALAFVLLWGIGVGLLNGIGPLRILSDMRLHIPMLLALVVAVKVWDTPLAAKCVRVVQWSLWVSAGLLVLASATGFQVGGRTEGTVQTSTGLTDGATRLLTPTQYPALVVVCMIIGLVLAGVTTFREQWKLLVPAAFVVLLAFSRNHVLAIVVTIAFAVLALRSFKSSSRLVATVSVAAVVFGLLSLGASQVLSEIPGAGWASQQVDAYSARVLDGVSEQSRERDASAEYRLREQRNLLTAIDAAPVEGHGFGYAYQAPTGPTGQFFREQGPYYAHNYYLWLAVKAGLLGLAAFLLATVGVLARVLISGRHRAAVPAAATLAGLMAVLWVAPLPLGSPASAVFGAVLGLAAAAVHPVVKRDERKATEPGVAVSA